MNDRLKRQLEFSLEIDKVKNIFRQTHLSGKGRRENDAEHSWHMAVMAYLLREYSNGGADWKVRGIKAEQVYKRQEKTKLGSEEIYKVVDGIIQDNILKGNLRSTEESN